MIRLAALLSLLATVHATSAVNAGGNLSLTLACGAFAVGVPHDHSPATGLTHADLVVSRLDDAELLSLVEGRGGAS